ncbi:helix-turn-helix transcriptional regulator [Marinobacterium maritimum]|uniref:helix-turn-helix transcriptional regulator n=1 Tax=Marinobacterium maritimum TaxID=500162 RepID=UPI0031D2DD32
MIKHDKLAQRLGLILTKLNAGERIHIDALAAEFNVSSRTIQRDLNQRLAYLPLERKGKIYWLLETSLGKRSNKDLRHFARTLDIEGMFPFLDDKLISTLLDQSQRAPYLVKGMSFENAKLFASEFKILEESIRQYRMITFLYKGKNYDSVHPYRLVNYKGVWYLAGTHDDRLKSFVISGISSISIKPDCFSLNKDIDETIQNCSSIWYGSDSTEVILKASPDISNYFQRRSLLPDQKVIHQFDNGGLLLSSKINHPTQITPLVKYWVPHLEVLSPNSVKEKVINDLSQALDQISR